MIGKGQITIPQEWRMLLGVEDGVVKATLEGEKIILEPLPVSEQKNWKVEWISLNELSQTDQKLVKEGRKAYRAGKKEKFLTPAEFFKNS
jgi:bifunctional DNA-binding transcriptional regulator/antitoxin component of YhaV-PrlF toxin-antitoxin module